MARALGLTVASLVLLLASTGCASPSQREEMNTQSLYGDAAEGARLAGLIARGQTTGVFARAHAQELEDDVTQVEQNVADQSIPGAERIQQLADQLGSALGDLATHPDDGPAASHAETALTELAAKLAKLGS